MIFIFLGKIFSQSSVTSKIPASQFKVQKKSFCSEWDESSPVLCGDHLYFISNQPVEVGMKHFDKENHRPLYRIVSVNLLSTKDQQGKQLIDGFLKNHHEGPFYINKTEDHVWYTGNHSTKTVDGKKELVIREAVLTKRGWKESSMKFFDTLNGPSAHPCIFDNGKKMIFSAALEADRKNGMDLYFTTFENNNWTKPRSLGRKINTDGNEAFPFVDQEGNLYYSSNGMSTEKKDFDFYFVNLAAGDSVPVKLPEPFNSNGEETGISWNPKTFKGYFSSNRNGNDDIFSVELQWPRCAKCDTISDASYCYHLEEESSEGFEDTTAMTYEWDFGDGAKQKGLKVSHCFGSKGIYVVKLNIVDKTTGVLFFNQTTYELEVNDSFPINSVITLTNGKQVINWEKKNAGDSILKVFYELNKTPFYSGTDKKIELPVAWTGLKEFYIIQRQDKTDTLCFERSNRKTNIPLRGVDTLFNLKNTEDINYKIHVGSSDKIYPDLKNQLGTTDTLTAVKDTGNLIRYFLGAFKDVDSAIIPFKKLLAQGFSGSRLIAFNKDKIIPGQSASLKTRIESIVKEPGYLAVYSLFYGKGSAAIVSEKVS
ncbi:MAG: PD40 domain-containing protein, partial [Bacteroidia bacterium]|nr:PD40 domain-containing protein [Bacteroidia bacterium]